MNTTLPSITKLVQELEERNLLVKQAMKRCALINLTLTEEERVCGTPRDALHGEWASACQIWTTRWWTVVHAITRMQETMPE